MRTRQTVAVVHLPELRRSRTFADLMTELGDIAADRILLEPLPGLATEKDLLRLIEVDHVLCELIDGVLVEKPMGWGESSLGMWLGSKLREYLNKHNIGDLGGADSTLRLRTGLVRLPDLAFVNWEHMPEDEDLSPIPDLAPDLAVEIVSRSNTPKEMARKRQEYFQAGTALVWQIYPISKTVEVFTTPTTVRKLSIADTLDGGKVLPGFSLPLKTLFGRPTKPSRRKK